jgi:type 1 glutamine amidotransferase
MLHQRHFLLAALITASTLVASLGTMMQASAQEAATPAPRPAPAKDGRTPIKALFLTGGCCHDYAAQMRILSEGISKFANVEWTLVREGGTGKDFINPRFNDPDWAKPYDVVIHDSCFADVKDADYIRKVLKPHHEGTAAVVLHCAMHTFRDAPNANEYREFLGITTHEHEPATALEVKPLPAAAKHPILTGFPDVWKTPINDEAYIVLKVWPNTTPLATTYGKSNNIDFPCVWTTTYGKGRVFGTTLGHGTPVVADPTYIALVARGLLWSVDKLTPDGKAAPGYEPAPTP